MYEKRWFLCVYALGLEFSVQGVGCRGREKAVRVYIHMITVCTLIYTLHPATCNLHPTSHAPCLYTPEPALSLWPIAAKAIAHEISSIHSSITTWICIHICMFIRMEVRMCGCEFISMFEYTCMLVCLCKCMCMYICV